MKMLVAENSNGQFKKVGIYYVCADGRVEIPERFRGEVQGYFIRSAARHLTMEPSAEWIDYHFGNSPIYRMSRT